MATAPKVQKEALSDYQSKAVRQLLGDQDITQTVGRALNNPQEFGALVGLISGDPAAKAGLKRATLEYLMRKALSTAEEGTSDIQKINASTLQKQFINSRKALSTLFDKQELESMASVMADLQRANRSNVALKIPAGSNTAQDTWGRISSALQKMVREYGGKAVGATVGTSVLGPVGGAAGFFAGAVWDALSAAKMTRVEDALVEMMLNPKMAAKWMAKVPETEMARRGFAQQLRSVMANQVVQAMADEDQN